MMKVVSAAVVLSLVGVCRAQPSGDVRILLSADGVRWSDSLIVSPGSLVRGGMFIEFQNGYGVSGIVGQIRGDGIVPGDQVISPGPGLNRVPPFTFGAATAITWYHGTWFRIDAASDAQNNRNAGISIAQNSPHNVGTNFCSDNPALVFRFDVVLSQATGLRSMVIGFPWDQIHSVPTCNPGGVLGIYENPDSTRGTNNCMGPNQTHPATLTVACDADFNLDGFVDFFDAVDFIDCFDREHCPAGRTADLDHNDFVSFFDFNAFVDAYEAGC